ncbi:hypothetical protein [Streptomyces fulvorobeus]|uniref:Uncharacterized protein n=1 Tax=Streptomyces fulvorobeus TaxID=284028 RepID=A0A7Y9KZR2_9ACTN|nr:hypothetical protein [Streptomyces fulvorobeus]NYE44262.1 hypothetical protein [Streptomyces fulvorobeus]
MTLECGVSARIDGATHRRLLGHVEERGYERTAVRGGYVVTLPGDALVAVLRESTYAGRQGLC